MAFGQARVVAVWPTAVPIGGLSPDDGLIVAGTQFASSAGSSSVPALALPCSTRCPAGPIDARFWLSFPRFGERPLACAGAAEEPVPVTGNGAVNDSGQVTDPR